MCELGAAGLEENQTSGLRKTYKLYLRKRRNVAIGICKEDAE